MVERWEGELPWFLWGLFVLITPHSHAITSKKPPTSWNYHLGDGIGIQYMNVGFNSYQAHGRSKTFKHRRKPRRTLEKVPSSPFAFKMVKWKL